MVQIWISLYLDTTWMEKWYFLAVYIVIALAVLYYIT